MIWLLLAFVLWDAWQFLHSADAQERIYQRTVRDISFGREMEKSK